jgi:hypothetical protein
MAYPVLLVAQILPVPALTPPVLAASPRNHLGLHSSTHNFPQVHRKRHLLTCPACGRGLHPSFRSCSGMFRLTLTDPSIPAVKTLTLKSGKSSPHSGFCSTLSSPLCADSLCLLTDPLDFEDPPPGVHAAVRTRCWTEMVSTKVCFLRSASSDLSLPKLSWPTTYGCSILTLRSL